MKKGTYILQIPEPCHENWHAMTPDGKGRFCMHCSKTIIDFTQLTDEQIIAHIQQQKGNLCGRFNQTQLNRTLQQESSRNLKQNKLQGFIAGLLLLLTTGNANANGITSAKTEIMQAETPNDSLTIKVVSSSTKQPLSFVTFQNKNNGIVTKTNIDGIFRISASKGDSIIVSCDGYTPKTFVIKSITTCVIVFLDPFDKDQVNLSKDTLTGTIVDAVTKQPLPFATIRNKKTGTGSYTDFDGKFTIPAANDDTIVISYAGYAQKVIVAKSATDLAMVPLEMTQSLMGAISFTIPEKHRLAYKIRRFFRVKPKQYKSTN